MSRTLDTLLDAQHGTVDGYRAGCRGSHCPAGEEHGLSCSIANTYAAGNWNYMKALRRGLTPPEIAAELGLHPAGGKPAPKTTKPVEHEPAPITKPEKEKTMTETPKPSQTEIRAWARANDIYVRDRGALPRAIVDAFNARGKGVQASDVKPAPTPEPVVEPATEAVVPTKAEAPQTVNPPASVTIVQPDWSLPLAAEDLRSIADALDALEKVPRNVIELDRIPVLRPGGDEVIGQIGYAAGFEDDRWLGFTPRGAA